MPYCINCGVKLKDQEKKCPLCETPVVYSNIISGVSECEGIPSKRQETPSAFDKDLWIKLISVIVAAPVLFTIAIDYLLGNGITWSLYILFSLLLVWVWCVSPFLFKRNIFYLWFSMDVVALLSFFFCIERLSQTGRWFFPLAFPLTIALAIMISLIVLLFRKKLLRQLQKPALLFFLAAAMCLVIEAGVDVCKTSRYQPGWSILAAIPCVAFAVILLILQKRQWIVEELRHWFRV